MICSNKTFLGEPLREETENKHVQIYCHMYWRFNHTDTHYLSEQNNVSSDVVTDYLIRLHKSCVAHQSAILLESIA